MTIDLKVKQRGVRNGALPALALTLAIIALATWWRRSLVTSYTPIEFAVIAMLVPALCVVAAIGNVANRRFFSVADIDGATTPDQSPQIVIASAILSNTLEQAFLAVILYAALAVLLPAPETLIAALATMFVIGRLCFAFGYSRGAGGRAFGFGVTFYPNAIGLVYACALVMT